ncbi:hypothetical protein NM12888_0516 [Neisseria meningitidis 12888]|nr:hypothetical protein NM12888_0516 [Neisseria meningitidis 12888]
MPSEKIVAFQTAYGRKSWNAYTEAHTLCMGFRFHAGYNLLSIHQEMAMKNYSFYTQHSIMLIYQFLLNQI